MLNHIAVRTNPKAEAIADDIIEYLYRSDARYWEGCAIDMYEELMMAKKSFRDKSGKIRKSYISFGNFHPSFRSAVKILEGEGWDIKHSKEYKIKYESKDYYTGEETKRTKYNVWFYKIDCNRLMKV